MNSDLSKFSAVVVDDEPLPLAHVSNLLKRAGVGRVFKARHAAECIELFETEHDPPDWAFLDVIMPEMDGLALADALKAGQLGGASAVRPPSIVYVTGHEEFAVQAFERAAVDYLLKPVEPERLGLTLERLVLRSTSEVTDARPVLPAPSLQRLPIRMNYAVRLVDIADIIAANAHEKRVDVITREAVYPTYYTLSQLELRLPADRFVRIHDGWLVNLEEVLEIHSLGDQTYQARLRADGRLVPISRRRLSLLQRRLGI